MAIPYANRTAMATIPELALKDQPKLTMEEVHVEFSTVVLTPLKETFACIQRVSRNQLRLTFQDATLMENTIFVGLTVRSHLLSIKPIHSRKWVSVTRLPYGIPKEAVEAALRPFGPINKVRQDTVNGISNGDFSLLMEVVLSIPCNLIISGHYAGVYYKGQKRTCFQRCGQTGHFVQKCPSVRDRAAPVPTADPGLDTVPAAQMTTGVSTPPVTYAQAVVPLVPPSTPVMPGTLALPAPSRVTSPPSGRHSAASCSGHLSRSSAVQR